MFSFCVLIYFPHSPPTQFCFCSYQQKYFTKSNRSILQIKKKNITNIHFKLNIFQFSFRIDAADVKEGITMKMKLTESEFRSKLNGRIAKLRLHSILILFFSFSLLMLVSYIHMLTFRGQSSQCQASFKPNERRFFVCTDYISNILW